MLTHDRLLEFPRPERTLPTTAPAVSETSQPAQVLLLAVVALAAAASARRMTFLNGWGEQTAATSGSATSPSESSQSAPNTPQPAALPDEIRGVQRRRPRRSPRSMKLDEYLALADQGLTALQLDVKDEKGRGRVHTPGAGARAPDRRRQAFYNPRQAAAARRSRGVLPHRSCRRLRRSHPRHTAVSARHRAPRRRLDERRRARLDEPVRRGRLEVQRRHRRGRRCRLRRDHVRLRPLPHRRRRLRGRVQRQAQGARPSRSGSSSVRALPGSAARRSGLRGGLRPHRRARWESASAPASSPSTSTLSIRWSIPPTSAPASTRWAIPTRSPVSPSRGRCATLQRDLRGRDTLLDPLAQDFSLGRDYTLEDVRAQILAARDAQSAGFLLWNPVASTRRPPCANMSAEPTSTRCPQARPGLWKMWKNELSANCENGPAPGLRSAGAV